MLHSIKSREDLEKVEELASSQNQVEEFRLQDKLGEQNLQENIYKKFEPVTDTIKKTSDNFFNEKRKTTLSSTKTITETSFNNNRASENLNKMFWN